MSRRRKATEFDQIVELLKVIAIGGTRTAEQKQDAPQVVRPACEPSPQVRIVALPGEPWRPRTPRVGFICPYHPPCFSRAHLSTPWDPATIRQQKPRRDRKHNSGFGGGPYREAAHTVCLVLRVTGTRNDCG
jgi:hypothetical protein